MAEAVVTDGPTIGAAEPIGGDKTTIAPEAKTGDDVADEGGADEAAKAAAAENEDKGGGKGTEDKSKEGVAAKKTADEQAANEAAKALLFGSLTDLQLPDGAKIDETIGKKFAAALTDSKATKQTAQIFADLALEATSLGIQREIARLVAGADAELQAWNKEIMADKELGGANIDATKANCEKFLELAATVAGVNLDRFKVSLKKSHMANQPDLIRTLNYISGFIGPDKLFIMDRSTENNARKTDAEIFYGGQPGTK
ncbi:MAG: hypothetical protein EXR86_12420 [Gammaproteobacteria bacterium]|nr:hypothetical protein [Gammaproteobacteria bacterium]